MVHNRDRGFLRIIILVIVALALLKYFFGISVKDLWNSQVTQDIVQIIKSLFSVIWDILLLLLNFLKELISTARAFISGLNK